MLASKAAYSKGRVAFHIYLISDKTNTLYSTLPYELLKRHLQKELFHLSNAIIVNQKMADRVLGEVSERILMDERFTLYFYPAYLFNLNLNFLTAERLIHFQDAFAVQPGMCFSAKSNPLEFFHIQQRFYLFRSYIIRRGKFISLDSFKSKFIVSVESQYIFESIQEGVCSYLDFEEEDADMAGVVDSHGSLIMLVSI